MHKHFVSHKHIFPNAVLAPEELGPPPKYELRANEEDRVAINGKSNAQ